MSENELIEMGIILIELHPERFVWDKHYFDLADGEVIGIIDREKEHEAEWLDIAIYGEERARTLMLFKLGYWFVNGKEVEIERDNWVYYIMHEEPVVREMIIEFGF